MKNVLRLIAMDYDELAGIVGGDDPPTIDLLAPVKDLPPVPPPPFVPPPDQPGIKNYHIGPVNMNFPIPL